MLNVCCVSGVFQEELLVRFGEIVEEKNRPLLRTVNALCSAKPVSTTSDRDKHKDIFKRSLSLRYQCHDPANANVTKCMILNHFFSTEQVTASHIVGLYERQICATLGFTDVWDPRNGILLFHEIDKCFENMEVVSKICDYCGSLMIEQCRIDIFT